MEASADDFDNSTDYYEYYEDPMLDSEPGNSDFEDATDPDVYEDGDHSGYQVNTSFHDSDGDIDIEITAPFDRSDIDLHIQFPQGHRVTFNQAQTEEEDDDSNEDPHGYIEAESSAEVSDPEVYSEDEPYQDTFQSEEDPDVSMEPESNLRVIVNNSKVYRMNDYASRVDYNENIPITTLHNRHLFEECAICFNPLYKQNTNTCYLECLHWYHFNCLSDWSKRKTHCPVCRRDFDIILKLK